MYPDNLNCSNGKLNGKKGEAGKEIDTERIRQTIRDSDGDTLSRILLNLNDQEREQLISRETLRDVSNACTYRHSDSALQRPCPILFEATRARKFASVDVLLENGFTFETRDTNGWNILHYLIAVSYFDPSYEATAVDIWRNVRKRINLEQLENLLKQEDLERLRPLELALHLECFLIFDEIINTPVYLSTKQQIGLWEHLTYDITEYENCRCQNDRRHKSPTLVASHIDRRVLKSEDSIRILRHGMLRQWVSSKLIINLIPIVIWFGLRLFFLFAFYIILSSDLPLYLRWEKNNGLLTNYLLFLNFTLETEIDYNRSIDAVYKDNITFTDENRDKLNEILVSRMGLCEPNDWYKLITVKTFYDVCFTFIVAFSIISIIFDILEIIVSIFRQWYRWRFAFGKKKTLIIASAYYRVCQFLFSLLILVWGTMYFFNPQGWFTEYGVIPTCYVSVWTVLYFIQMVPAIGHFVNSIQKMLTIMVQFLIVYIFILIPYPHAFLLLLSNDQECKPKGFDDIGHAIYSIFKIMLNMIDFDDYSNSRFSVHLLHIIYVFTVAILLVNFLIALLSTSVGETVEAGDVIMMLQRLSVVTTLERRLCFFCPLYYKIMNRLVYKCENGKIYLQCKRFSGVKISP